MDYIKAFLLGILESITEFVPVSSTGHLVIFGKYLTFSENSNVSNETFSIFIQSGAILAVIFLFYKDFFNLFDFKSERKISHTSFKGVNGLAKISLATIPLIITGFFFYDIIKSLFSSVSSIAYALIIGGILMIAVEKIKIKSSISNIENISFKNSFLIGLFQCLSLWAGFSRSASTIIGGMVLGINRQTSAKFSFLIGVPAILCATFYELLKNIDVIMSSNFKIMLIGFFTSFFFSLLVIQWFLKLLKKMPLTIFGIYRIIFGLIIIYLSYKN